MSQIDPGNDHEMLIGIFQLLRRLPTSLGPTTPLFHLPPVLNSQHANLTQLSHMAPAGTPPEPTSQSLHNRLPSFQLIMRTSRGVQMLSYMLTASWSNNCPARLPNMSSHQWPKGSLSP